MERKRPEQIVGERLAKIIFDRRSRKQRNVEIHITERDLAAILAEAFAMGLVQAEPPTRPEPTDHPTCCDFHAGGGALSHPHGSGLNV
jgi:hypothetical protein